MIDPRKRWFVKSPPCGLNATSQTEEEEEEEEGENNGDPDMESFVTDESALEVEEIAIGGEEGSDVDDKE